MFHFCLVLTFLLLDAADDQKKALQATSMAESYGFTVQEGKSQVTGTFQKRSPVALRSDDIDFFRQGDLLIYRSKDTWQKTRTGTLSDPLPILGASAKVRAVKLPHEELALLDKAVQNIKVETDADFSGDLDMAGARSLARIEDRELARRGTVQFWLNAQGQITKYRLAIRLQGRRGNAEVDGVFTQIVTIRDIGAAKVELPEAARALLKP